jgi:hypothetical protein
MTIIKANYRIHYIMIFVPISIEYCKITVEYEFYILLYITFMYLVFSE